MTMFRTIAVILLMIAVLPAVAQETAAPAQSCAETVLIDALRDSAPEYSVDENSPNSVIERWIGRTFRSPDVAGELMDCPEFADLSDSEPVAVPVISYKFPNGREIQVAFRSTKKIMRSRSLLTDKRNVAGIAPETAAVTDADGDEWINTEPAWYGIAVVRAGAFDKYVAASGNNTVSLDYIRDHIDDFYPAHHGTTWMGNGWPHCVSRSAFANNNDTVNIAMHRTVGEQNKFWSGNDFYVADPTVNLQWRTWAEVAFDVVLTVATAGVGTSIKLSGQMARLVNRIRNITKSADALHDASAAVKNFVKAGDAVRDLEKTLDAARAAGNADDIARLTRQLDSARDAMNAIDKSGDVGKYIKYTDDLNKLGNAEQMMRAAMRGKPWRGNIIARPIRAWKAGRTARSAINATRGSARAALRLPGTFAGKVGATTRNYLFHTTRKFGVKIGKNIRKTGLLYGAVKFIGGLWDWVETSSDEFTSGNDFKAPLLLFADNLSGQENVINDGMFIMFAGSGVDAADDDAAFLQAMDTAEKFYQDLDETQQDLQTFGLDFVRQLQTGATVDASEVPDHPDAEMLLRENNLHLKNWADKIKGEFDALPDADKQRLRDDADAQLRAMECDVDIYVVRPIIRNPDEDGHGQMYYLIMNDEPWKVRSEN